MKRVFKVRCSNEKTDLVKSIVSRYQKMTLFKSNDIIIDKSNYDFNEISFKCTKNKLNECRNVLRELTNTGILLTTVEIW